MRRRAPREPAAATPTPPTAKPAKSAASTNGTGRFGTFAGVFTPCTLTILGVIMYLRFGRVVGQAGILHAVVIVLLAKMLTTLTALSLSAIATNTRVKGGGAYFLISRSLGVGYGGAIGAVFYLAQAVSVAMYVIGFSEALVAVLPTLGLSVRGAASIVNLGVFVTVFIGAGWAIRVQYVILGLLAASLLSFFAGAIGKIDGSVFQANLASAYEGRESFFTAFALFFPAATGIMAGANLSGDLKDPGRSIPRGTLTAIFVTGLVYVALALTLGATVGRAELRGESMVMEGIAISGALIVAGVFAATLSSAIGSMLGAPRILQALGRDNVFPRLGFFGAGSGPNSEPRRATTLTFLIAQACILLGDLDTIAPVITMFFLLTYGYLNLATFGESVTRNPSYRPTFRYSHWATALLGALGCAAVMFLIAPLWATVAVATVGLLHWWIARRSILATWGDLHGGAAFARARRDLLRLEDDRYHPKNWRPSILALSGPSGARVHLAAYAHWLAADRGAVTLAQVIPGDIGNQLERRANQESALRSFIREKRLTAFPAVVVAQDLPQGIEALVQCSGIGAFRPNVVLFGWSSDPERESNFVNTLRTVAGLKRSMVIVRPTSTDGDPWVPPPGPIDVWWRGKENGHLMVLFAHLLTLNDVWRDRPIRLLRLVPSEAGREAATEHLTGLLRDARVRATPVVLVGDDIAEVLHHTSAHASLVFLGFRPPEEGREEAFAGAMNRLMDGLGTVLMVSSTGEMHLEA